jgi:hypothetical protein
MAFRIEGGKAIVAVTWEGKPAEFVLRRATFKEFAFLVDETVDLKGGSVVKVKLGSMLIGLLPKCIEKAPFPIGDNNALYNMPMDASIMDLLPAMLELHGFGKEVQGAKNG